ncbi:MFS transporter [Halocynthiibacter sp. C4]|uniref:MFS transporter n=1 Tax=Halocynthiibacter sp. C4 TaxID=2992758 RepID=UPI00237A9CFA|nr:MFS transporter [Halocynthiibacter sp. C4]MDE0589741.1 MFS transporter [Halocynthiibacter sp. C4]
MQKPVLLLTATVGVVGSNSLVLSPIAARVAQDLGGVTPSEVMSCAAFYGLGVALSALFLAPLADRFGADRALKLALALLAVAFLGSAMAKDVMLLSVAQSIAGLGAGVAIPALYILAAQIAPVGQEARVIGKVLTGWTLSMVGGVTLSAYVADLAGWRFVYGGLSFGVFTMLAFILRTEWPQVPRATQVTSPLTALRVEGIGAALLSVGALGMGFYGVYNFVGSHVVENIGLNVRDVGILTLLYGAGFAGAMMFDGMLDRLPVLRSLAVLFGVLAGVYVLFYEFAHSYTFLLAIMPIWGALQHLCLNLTIGWLTRLDPNQRGAIMGLNSATMYLSVFLGTLLYRPFFESYGLSAGGAISLLATLVGIAVVLNARWQQVRILRSGDPAA